MAGQRLRLSGQINTADNASDFSTDKLVGGYTVRNGQLEGELLTYFPNGALASRAAMSAGKFHGPRTEYDANGAVRKTTIYRNDVPEGETNIFDRKGTSAH